MTRASAGPAGRRSASDEGFTLIEVIVALFLLGVVATAVLVFFIKGVQTTAHLQRAQAADAVATQAMEQVRSVSAQTPTTGSISGVLVGRTQSAVQTAWNAVTAVHPDYTADSIPAWDPSATPPSPTVPIESDVSLSGIGYHVTTLIGTCYRVATAASGDQSCVASPTTGVPILRAIVIVTWKPTSADQCGGAALCTYNTRTLLDPTADPAWNLTTTPVAFDDDMGETTAESGPTDSAVVANDLIGPVTVNPIINITDPTVMGVSDPTMFGTASAVSSVSAPWLLRYTPSHTSSGIVTFTYQLQDAAGRKSNNLAKVTIKVDPVAHDVGPISVTNGSSNVIDLSGKVTGTFASSGAIITITSPPSMGSITGISGTKITYTAPPAGSGTSQVTFGYTITDTSGLKSGSATVTLNATDPLVQTPTAPNQTFTVSADKTLPLLWSPLNILAGTGNTFPNSTIHVQGLTPGGGSLSGSDTSVISYQPPLDAAGSFTFSYVVTNRPSPPGKSSPVGTITVNVTPFAVNDNASQSNGRTATVAVLSNDTPDTGMVVSIDGTATCGSPTVDSQNRIVFTPPSNNNKKCSVGYKIYPLGAPSLTAGATLTVTWGN